MVLIQRSSSLSQSTLTFLLSTCTLKSSTNWKITCSIAPISLSVNRRKYWNQQKSSTSNKVTLTVTASSVDLHHSLHSILARLKTSQSYTERESTSWTIKLNRPSSCWNLASTQRTVNRCPLILSRDHLLRSLDYPQAESLHLPQLLVQRLEWFTWDQKK